MAGKRVVLDAAETRLWIKSETGERLIDLHKEPGAMTLTVPGAADQALSIFVERKSLGANGRPIVLEHSILRSAETVKLAALTPIAPTVGARGDRLFGALFEAPYGPQRTLSTSVIVPRRPSRSTVSESPTSFACTTT